MNAVSEAAHLETINLEAIDAHIERELRRLQVPGAALAVVEEGRIVHARGFGNAHPHGATPTALTPFWIGSLTKSITALAVMQLVEAGKIDLDAPVCRCLPWFRLAGAQQSERITVRHLLHQTSGLPCLAGEMQLADFARGPDAAERQGRALAAVAPAHPAGLRFEYCNANYNLLGLVIEAASGEAYASYVQEHILDPLEMRHTYVSPVEAQQGGLAVGHRYWFAAPRAAHRVLTPPGSLAAGGLISTGEDIARYLIACLQGGRYQDVQILSQAGMAELQRGVADFPMWGFGTRQYGMGWFVEQIGGRPVIWHSGTTPDFAAHMALLPEQGRGFVLLMNANHHMMVPTFIELGMGVAALLAGVKPGAIPFRIGAWAPWALRSLLLLPAAQLAGAAWTLRLWRRWRREPQARPGGPRLWGLPVLLPLLANLLAGLFLLRPLLGRRRGYLLLYAADYAWTAQLCGGFALLWAALRTGLALAAHTRAPRRRSGENPTRPSSAAR